MGLGNLTLSKAVEQALGWVAQKIGFEGVMAMMKHLSSKDGEFSYGICWNLEQPPTGKADDGIRQGVNG